MTAACNHTLITIIIDLHLSLPVQSLHRSDGSEIRVTWLWIPPAKPPITYTTVCGAELVSGSNVIAWAYVAGGGFPTVFTSVNEMSI